MTNADKLRASAPNDAKSDDAKLARELADGLSRLVDESKPLHPIRISIYDARAIVRLLRAWLADKNDVERYRWLRKAGCNIRDEDGPAEWYALDIMDEAIDAGRYGEGP